MTEYDSKTVLQLQNLLCERQIVFKKKEKKASLIRLLTDYDEAKILEAEEASKTNPTKRKRMQRDVSELPKLPNIEMRNNLQDLQSTKLTVFSNIFLKKQLNLEPGHELVDICQLPCYLVVGDTERTEKSPIYKSCVVCSKNTKYLCRQCSLINFGEPVPLCNTVQCKSYHEKLFESNIDEVDDSESNNEDDVDSESNIDEYGAGNAAQDHKKRRVASRRRPSGDVIPNKHSGVVRVKKDTSAKKIIHKKPKRKVLKTKVDDVDEDDDDDDDDDDSFVSVHDDYDCFVSSRSNSEDEDEEDDDSKSHNSKDDDDSEISFVDDSDSESYSEEEESSSHKEKGYKSNNSMNEDEGDSQPKGSIAINPPRKDVYIDVQYTTRNSSQSVYLGSFNCERDISLLSSVDNSIPKDCTFDIQSFVLPDGLAVSEEDLMNGAFSSFSTAPMQGVQRDRVVPLRRFKVEKKDEVVSPSFIDTGANVVAVSFIHEDKPLANSEMTGTFTSSTGQSISMKGKTDDHGKAEMVLPPKGSASVSATTNSGKRLPPVKIMAPSRPFVVKPHEAPEPIKTTQILESTVMAQLSGVGPFLVLGDVSGSMANGKRMQNLRITFKSLFDKAISKNIKIAMAAWESRIHFMPQQKYLTANDVVAVDNWLSTLCSNGGTEMDIAIRDGINKFSDANDIYVLCDGDVSSFDKYANKWETFIDDPKYHSKRFHFVALERDADHSAMQKMAMTRAPFGTFTSANA